MRPWLILAGVVLILAILAHEQDASAGRKAEAELNAYRAAGGLWEGTAGQWQVHQQYLETLRSMIKDAEAQCDAAGGSRDEEACQNLDEKRARYRVVFSETRPVSRPDE